jgi:hypothetical protein
MASNAPGFPWRNASSSRSTGLAFPLFDSTPTPEGSDIPASVSVPCAATFVILLHGRLRGGVTLRYFSDARAELCKVLQYLIGGAALNGQILLFAALSVAAIVLAVVLAMTLWRIRGTIDHMDRRMDEAIRQFEMTAEDIRKTNAVMRDILLHAERAGQWRT